MRFNIPCGKYWEDFGKKLRILSNTKLNVQQLCEIAFAICVRHLFMAICSQTVAMREQILEFPRGVAIAKKQARILSSVQTCRLTP